MKSYRLSYEARQDYFDAFDYIAGHSLRAALKWEDRMLEAFDHLAEWPQTGRIRPEYAPDHLRFWVAEEYLVVYDPSSDPLAIIGIIHGAQDLVPLISRRSSDYAKEMEDDHA